MFFVSGRQALVSIERLRELEENKEEFPPENLRIAILEDKIERIEIEKLSVSHNNNEYQLKNINLSIIPKSWVAIVGPVGAGKSTLIKVIAGAIIPSEGDVFINRQPICYMKREDIAKIIGFVESEPIVFSTSIFENIRFFRNISLERVYQSSKIAQIFDEIEQLPKKFDEPIGEKGILLSGGQKQRIAIARAVAHHPSILILDDVTSSLDADNEAKFLESLADNFKDLTCIYATHRLSSARKADVIVCLENGKIAGYGTHTSLLENCPIYKKMVDANEMI